MKKGDIMSELFMKDSLQLKDLKDGMSAEYTAYTIDDFDKIETKTGTIQIQPGRGVLCKNDDGTYRMLFEPVRELFGDSKDMSEQCGPAAYGLIKVKFFDRKRCQ